MQDSVRKVPFRCPSCGFVQHEPQGLISTYCRGCGSHYEAGAEPPAPAPSTKELLLHRVFLRPPVPVHCYRCGQVHEVSSSARSTICPGCSSSIELGDLTFSSNVSRPIDIRGQLTIERTGYLHNAYIVCGDALIEGRINGTLRCERTLRLGCSGTVECRIMAQSVTIEKGAVVELLYPLCTSELIVHGTIRGQFECAGSVHVSKKGSLIGTLTARAMRVDRGGILSAESKIQPNVRTKPIQNLQSSAHETGGLGAPLPFRHLLAY